jgi:NAD(P)-dependent dehydrogenase (short-subunit alcohol dehydrogenase family)
MRTAVVTGAAGGIGAAVCDHLESVGWEVVAVDRLPSARRGAIQLDIADEAAIDRVLGSIPRADALVNNAAVQLYKPLSLTSTDEWEELQRVNLRAPWLCVKALLSELSSRSGAIVNVASVHAIATSLSIGAYATTKGGLTAFTRAAALELAEHGIRVNAVVPGAIGTPALRAGFAPNPDAEALLVARTPLRRIGSPLDVAKLVAFLLDNSQSGFITGASIPIDGGVLAKLSSE